MVALRFLIVASVAGLLTTVLGKPRDDGSCDANHTCGSDNPCCSSAGFCGQGSDYCLAGCNPYASLSFQSCRAMPRCQSQTIDFTNGATPWIPLERYKGNPSVAPLTLDGGTMKPGVTGAKLLVTPNGKNRGGTVLSTTRYFYYGTMAARMRHK